MDTKLIRVLDRATEMSLLCTNMQYTHYSQHYNTASECSILARAGYGPDFPIILVTRSTGGPAHTSPFDWNDRTVSTAHKFILEKWDELVTGSTVDVRTILGEDAPPAEEYRHPGFNSSWAQSQAEDVE